MKHNVIAGFCYHFFKYHFAFSQGSNLRSLDYRFFFHTSSPESLIEKYWRYASINARKNENYALIYCKADTPSKNSSVGRIQSSIKYIYIYIEYIEYTLYILDRVQTLLPGWSKVTSNEVQPSELIADTYEKVGM